MTERKTLNRYYPVDYDPAKIPKLKQKQKDQNRLWGIRVMAPFNMRCNTCGGYIYKGKKFNSKKETVTTEDYLGIQIHRFYIRCPTCIGVIAFKTDPANVDYSLESGATRNFEAAKTLMEIEKKKLAAAEAEEAANPMKVLENRTKQSRNEMDTMEALTELREMNARHEKVDHDGMIKKAQLYQQELARLQQAEEDRLIRELFGSAEEADGETVRRVDDSDSSDGEEWAVPAKRIKQSPSGNSVPSASSEATTSAEASSSPDATTSGVSEHRVEEQVANPTDLLTNGNDEVAKPSLSDVKRSKALPHKKPSMTKGLLSNLVKIKKPVKSETVKSEPKTSAIKPEAIKTEAGYCSSTTAYPLTPTHSSLPVKAEPTSPPQSKEKNIKTEPGHVDLNGSRASTSAVPELAQDIKPKTEIANIKSESESKPTGALGMLGSYSSSSGSDSE